MKNIAIIYGGNSYEKDVSIITACQVMKNIDKKKYKIFPIYLDDTFKIVKDAQNIESYKDIKIIKNVEFSNKKLYEKKKGKLKLIDSIDCALLCTHGGEGENGILQAYLEMNNIPYTSSNHVASVCGMYKNLTKAYLNENKIKNVKYTYLNEMNQEKLDSITYPCIVKPNSLGSSIGVSIANNVEQLNQALDIAFNLDNEIIIEKALTNFKEYNIACLKDNDKIIQSQIEEVKNSSGYLSFEEKYMNSSNNMRILPANINKIVENKIRSISEICYKNLQMQGVCRFDFLVDEKSRVYLNEFNTIPGAMAYYLFKGISFKDLIEIIIENSIKNFAKERKIFETNILQNLDLNQNNIKCVK